MRTELQPGVQPVLLADGRRPVRPEGWLPAQLRLTGSSVFVRRAYVPESLRPNDLRIWPYSVPCVAELVEHGLEFTHPVTFVVGDNGSGKSTLVEADR